MTSRAGVLRSAEGLAEAAELLDKLGATQASAVDLESWETTNLLTISGALTDCRGPPRGDPRLALARRLPRARRRRLRRPLRHGDVRRRHHDHIRARTSDRRRTLMKPSRVPQELREEIPTRGWTLRRGLSTVCSAGSRRTCPAAHSTPTPPPRRPLPPTPGRGAEFATREDGVVAGLAVAALVFHVVIGDDVAITDRLSDGMRVERRRRRACASRAHPRPAHGGAHRAQLRLSSLGRRHRHRGLGGRARRHQRAGARHPQDPARLPGPPEVRRPLRRRRQPPVQPRRPGAGQGQPRDRRRRRGAGLPGRRGGVPRSGGWRSR